MSLHLLQHLETDFELTTIVKLVIVMGKLAKTIIKCTIVWITLFATIKLAQLCILLQNII